MSDNRTPDHLLTLKSLVNKYVTDKSKSKLYTCFVDFRKAFDTVWHQGVYQKLSQANITGNFLETLKDMYNKTECAVKIGGKLTQFFPCKKGVRQGDPLSPLLFNIFINGIFDELREENCDPVTLDEEDKINAMAYADDIVLVSTTKEGLQKAIDIVHNYCEKWKLEVNSKKTKCMTFTKGTQKEKNIFTIGGKPLENVKEFKYLGIVMNKKNCTFTPAIQALKTKATRALYGLRAKVNLYALPVSLALKLFDSLIKPIFLYASEAWEPFLNQDTVKWDYNDIEKVHMQFLKRVLGVNRATTNILVRGEVNRHSLQWDITRRNIKYAKYINNKEDHTLVKQAYNYELRRPTTSITFTNTIDKHTEALHSIHKQFHPYRNPYENIFEISDDKMWKYTYQIFHNEWKNNLENSRKGENYNSYKQNMKYEPYLETLNRKQRVIFTKIRVSDHKLMIEEGRRTTPKIPPEQRTCKICPTKVENEEHFIMECCLYGSRETFHKIVTETFPKFKDLNHQQKFSFLMTQEDEKITKLFATEIEKWLSLRNFISLYFFQP